MGRPWGGGLIQYCFDNQTVRHNVQYSVVGTGCGMAVVQAALVGSEAGKVVVYRALARRGRATCRKA